MYRGAVGLQDSYIKSKLVLPVQSDELYVKYFLFVELNFISEEILSR